MTVKIKELDLKKPDAFVDKGQHLLQWIDKNTKLIVGIISLFVLLGAGVVSYKMFSDKKEVQAQEEYFLLDKSYSKKKSNFEAAKNAKNEEAAKKNGKAKETTPAVDDNAVMATGDLEKDFGVELNGFKEFSTRKAGLKAGDLAALQVADIYMTYDKYEEAKTWLADVVKKTNRNSLTGAMVINAYGTALANSGDCGSAISQWDSLAKVKDLNFMSDELSLKKAICYESMGDKAKAEELYKNISSKDSSALKKTAAQMLRLLSVQ